jgi:serine/threonine protein kinase
MYLLLQLTDFGLSKVGLINSTDDLSGPAVSGTSLLGEDESHTFTSEDQRERRKKRSAVGTPDYLAPEILLGTGHGSYSPIFMFKVVRFLFSFTSFEMQIILVCIMEFCLENKVILLLR